MTRIQNNPLPENILLPLLVPVLVPGTQLALGSSSGTGVEQVYVTNKFALSQGRFPAVLLSPGTLISYRCSLTTYDATPVVDVVYYDRWDRQPGLTTDDLREQMESDLQRMYSNLESFLDRNQGFTVNGQVYPVSLGTPTFTAYDKEALEREFPGLPLDARVMHIPCIILPYHV